MPKQYCSRAYNARRVGILIPALRNHTRRGAVNSFKHSIPLTDIGTTRRTDTALNLSGLVRQNIPVKIRHNKHLKPRPAFFVQQLSCHDIYVPLVRLNSCILCGDLLKYLQKLTVGSFQNISLSNSRNLSLSILLRIIKRSSNNSPAPFRSSNGEVHRQILINIKALTAKRIRALRVFPEECPVNTERLDLNRTHIREQVQLFTHGDVSRFDIRHSG